MKLHCPACGAEMTLDVVIGVEAAREAVLAALLLPAPLGKLLIAYLALFRPAKRQLSWERVASLFADLALPMAEGKIQRRGRIWPARLDYWRAALEEILAKRDKLTLPLKSHGYLFEIIVGYGERAEKAGEQLREQARKYPYSTERGGGSGTIAEVAARAMPEDVREQLAKIGVLKDRVKGAKNGD